MTGCDAPRFNELRESGFWLGDAQDARHRLWQPMPNVLSLEALNEWLETRWREL